MTVNEEYQADEYFKLFQEDISNVWIKKLLFEFSIQNNLVSDNLKTSLEEPNFAFSFSKTQWGSWCLQTRTLTLSFYLFKNFEWDGVVQTLKHEMAHMICDEIWGDINASGHPHGELFQKACKIMGIEGKKATKFEEKASYRIPEREKIVSKIHKLFHLGESNHKAEAEAAISKAHELMIKYNVSLQEVPSSERIFVSRPSGAIYSKVPEYVKDIARIVSNHYFVKRIFCTYKYGYMDGSRTTRYVEFYGEPHNLDIAEYVFHFLLIEGEREWKEFQKTEEFANRYEDDDISSGYFKRRKKSKYTKVGFLDGFASGVSTLLHNRKTQIKNKIDPQNTLPVWNEDALLKEKYNGHYKPVTWHSNGGHNGGGYRAGRARGEKVRIRQGVSSSGSRGKMLTA